MNDMSAEVSQLAGVIDCCKARVFLDRDMPKGIQQCT